MYALCNVLCSVHVMLTIWVNTKATNCCTAHVIYIVSLLQAWLLIFITIEIENSSMYLVSVAYCLEFSFIHWNGLQRVNTYAHTHITFMGCQETLKARFKYTPGHFIHTHTLCTVWIVNVCIKCTHCKLNRLWRINVSINIRFICIPNTYNNMCAERY